MKHSLLGIHGSYVKLAKDRPIQFPDWYKGPARLQDKLPPSIFELLFSRSNRYKGKFLPLSSNLNTKNLNQLKPSPGPTTYFPSQPQKSPSLNQEKTPRLGFLSSTERFSPIKSSTSHLGPASYQLHTCPRLCSKKKTKQINTNF